MGNTLISQMEKSVDAAKRALAQKAGQYDESKHPRAPKGSGRNAGRFAPKGGGGVSAKPSAPTKLARANLLRVFYGKNKSGYVDYRHFTNDKPQMRIHKADGTPTNSFVAHSDITDYDPNF